MEHTNLEEEFKSLKDIEHILKRPDTYIGTIKEDEMELWIYENDKMIKKKIKFIQGLYKIFDEILVNASDQYTRTRIKKSENIVKNVKIWINKDHVIVQNDGDGIPVQIHKESKVYLPEMIFGMLRSSSNYNDNENRIVGGKNGLGAKLTNIFSNKFIIETVDSVTQKKYIQEFRKNMSENDQPIITKCTNKPYTKIIFYPDFSRFNINDFSNDMINLMRKRTYDLTVICSDANIYLDDKKLDIKNFEKYVDLYFDESHKKYHELIDDRWDLCVTVSEDQEFQQVSFVNGIYTFNGGKHVEHVANNIAKKLHEYLADKKRNKVEIKADLIKKNMFLFLKCSIVNPDFTSQIKEELKTPVKDFGSTCKISDKFIEKLAKSEIIERSLILLEEREKINAKKTESKNKRIKIDKLDDAEWAGTKKSKECTLILTEGDSAKASVISSLSIIGHNQYGVYPLRGKIMNPKDESDKKLDDNKILSNIMTILGLERYYDNNGKIEKKVYKDLSELRYGKILILTDQDNDGHHIKGLIINFIHTFWPELLEMNFFDQFITPLIKATFNREILQFYYEDEYAKWKLSLDENQLKKYNIKYFKGLATTKTDDFKEYFRNLDKHKIQFKFNDKTNEIIEMAFAKKNADKRKEWLNNYQKTERIKNNEVTIEDFINQDLILFSIANCKRSIPSLCDGLKPSQRKILYASFKRNLKDEIKVAQLAGYVSENTEYHHGENNLMETIINMAQNYVGSNNINLLMPNGQFGTRLQNGKDSGAPRYIFTQLNHLTRYLYNKLDDPIMNYLEEDGIKIEPEYYLPIIPMILVNGSSGIGTGYSCKIPMFNPMDLIKIIKKALDDGEINIKELKPWYKGFKGKIEEKDNHFVCKGNYQLISANELEITEIPVNMSFEEYFEELEKLIEKDIIQGYKKGKMYNDVNFHIIVKLKDVNIDLEKTLFLSSNIATTNMHLFNHKNVITKYDNVGDIIKEFIEIRLEYYQKRKIYWTLKFKREIDILYNKIRFLQYILDNKINIRDPEDKIIEFLKENQFIEFDGNYDYLLRMEIRSLNQNRLDKMIADCKDKELEYERLNAKTEQQLWNEDIEEFIKEYEKDFKEYMKIFELDDTQQVIKIKSKKQK